jgi:hypothetical protein
MDIQEAGRRMKTNISKRLASTSENVGVRVLRGNRIVRLVPRKPEPRDVKTDAEGNPYTTKHPASGQRGRLLKLDFMDGTSETYLRKPVSKAAQRGMQRLGVQAKDLATEAVWTNEKTSPRIEVPRVLVETLKLDKSLTASDVAIWWRLFADARLSAMSDTNYIQLSGLAKFLGVRSLARIKASLKRLAAAKLSYHGRTGRVSETMLECPDAVDLDELKGADWMHFRMPDGLREIVLDSAGFCRIDLNALARFKSKFSSALYIRICYEAGKTKDFHDELHISKADFCKIVGLEAVQAEVVDDAIERVREDLLTIDGPRRRFDLEMYVGGNGKLIVAFGAAQKRLVETKPTYMTDEGLRVLADRSLFKLLPHQYPSIVRLRQAATMLDVEPVTISELWRIDVMRASSRYPEGCIGYTPREFRSRIRKLGADVVFGEWIERREFPEAWRVVREELTPVPAFERKKRDPKRLSNVLPAVVVSSNIGTVEGEDLRVGDELGVLEYTDVEGPTDIEFQDVNDDDIPD